MVINPYALSWQDDHYYLIGNYDKYDNLIHIRLDRISAVEITDNKSRHFSEVSDYKDFFDISDYTNRLFGMHSGNIETIELCCNKKITEQVFDRFSENIFIAVLKILLFVQKSFYCTFLQKTYCLPHYQYLAPVILLFMSS